MKTHGRSAVIVGILFIVATGFLILGQGIYDPILASPDYLERAHPDRLIVLAGLLLDLVSVLAIPLIPVFLFPILKGHGEPLALGYGAFRLLEAAFLIVVKVGQLSLIDVSRDWLAADGGRAATLQEIGISIVAVDGWAFLLSVGFLFPLGALMLNALLYRSRLVPRFLSIWGLLGATLLLIGSVLVTFEVGLGLEAVITIPIAVQEMVLALWLIVRGFDSAAIASNAA